MSKRKMRELCIVSLLPGQATAIDSMIGRYGSTREEVIKYLMIRSLEEFDKRGYWAARRTDAGGGECS